MNVIILFIHTSFCNAGILKILFFFGFPKLYPGQDDAENRREAETGFPIHRARAVPDKIPEEGHERDGDESYCEYGTKFND